MVGFRRNRPGNRTTRFTLRNRLRNGQAKKKPPGDISPGGFVYCVFVGVRSGLCLHHRGRLGDLAGRDTTRAHAYTPALTFVIDDLHRLEVGQPASPRLVVGVADIVPGSRAFAARVAHSSHLYLFLLDRSFSE